MPSNPAPSKSPDAPRGPSDLLGIAIIAGGPVVFFAVMFTLRALGCS